MRIDAKQGRNRADVRDECYGLSFKADSRADAIVLSIIFLAMSKQDKKATAIFAQALKEIDERNRERICPQCGKVFRGVARSDKKLCSDSCKMKAYRQRKQAADSPAKPNGTSSISWEANPPS